MAAPKPATCRLTSAPSSISTFRDDAFQTLRGFSAVKQKVSWPTPVHVVHEDWLLAKLLYAQSQI